MKRYLSLAVIGVLGVSLFTGCATTQLQTQAKMTRSIFLEPVKKSQKIVYVTVKNTSGHEINLEPKLVSLIRQKGYKITDDPDTAKYILIVNVLFADNLREANAANAASTAGTIGAIAGSFNGGRDSLITGLAAAAVGGVLGKITEDNIFRMVVDVSVREKINQKVITSENSSIGQAVITNQRRAGFMNTFAGPIRSKDGAGKLNDNIQEQKQQQYATDYIEKKTRVFAEAIKMNLTLAEAMPILEEKIAKQIAGIF
jgi:hypothetical protein